MIIYHTGEAFNFKKSKVFEVILKIAVGFLCALSLFYLNKTVSEVKQLIKYENTKDKNPYVGYYVFKPILIFGKRSSVRKSFLHRMRIRRFG